jgi:hypothetical protein
MRHMTRKRKKRKIHRFKPSGFRSQLSGTWVAPEHYNGIQAPKVPSFGCGAQNDVDVSMLPEVFFSSFGEVFGYFVGDYAIVGRRQFCDDSDRDQL